MNDEPRLSIVELGLSQMKEDIQEIKKDLKEFISSVDSKYATKQELGFLKESISEKLNDNKTQIQKVVDWVAKWGPVLAMIAFAILGKVIV